MMTLRMQRLMLFILVVSIFMVLATPPAFSVLPSATLSVDPSSGIIIDPTYTIKINISHVENLWAIHFKLTFNDGVDFLHVDIPEGVEPGNLTGPQATVDSHIASIGGITHLDVTVLAPNWENNGTVTGQGSIAKITFKLMPNARPEMISWLKLELADAVYFTGQGFDPIVITLVSGTVTVGLLKTILTLSAPSTATVEKPIILSTTLTDSGGNPLVNQTIDYYANSQKWGSDDTDHSGVSSTQYTPTDVGTLNVQAVYSGSLIYAGSNDTAIITVNPMSTTLSLEVPWSIKVSETVDLKATLKDEVGNPLEGKSIHFYVNSQEISGSPVTTISSGLATIEYTFNNVGDYEIEAEFLGTEKYYPSSDSVIRTVAEVRTTLTLSVWPLWVKVDEPVSMNATLKDEVGNPLEGQSVHFYADSQEIPGSPVTTNSSGAATIEYRPPVKGFFTVEAVFKGKLPYMGSNASGGILVFPIPTTLTLSVATTATVDRPTTITATLEDEVGNPLEGQSIHFYVDSLEIPNSPTPTDSSGLAFIIYTPPAVGTFEVRVWYNGSAKYGESSDEGELIVKRLTTTLSLDVPASARVEDEITLTATLKDQDGNPIPASIIDYQIFLIGWNPLGSEITNPSGTASLDYTPTEAGTFKIRAKYSETEKYAGSTSEEATLTVNKVTTTLTITAPPTSAVQNSFPITATLNDEYGNPLPDSTIYYQILQNGEWIGIGSAQTISNGIALIIYQLNEGGTFKFKATYGGTEKYAGSTSEEATVEVTSGTPEEPETPKKPWNPWGFLLDEKMTTLDILFWIIVIVSFATGVIVIVWRKIR